MKKTYLLILIGLVSTLKLEAKKIEGKIIFQKDTLNVIFDVPIIPITKKPDFLKLQNGIEYYTKTSKQTIMPYQAKEISFFYDGEEVHMLSRTSMSFYSTKSRTSNIFLKLEKDGYLKLFNYYFIAGSMSAGNAQRADNYFLQKGEGELITYKGITFKKDMHDFFSDCPALVSKIESYEFRNNDIEQIVEFYNSNCR